MAPEMLLMSQEGLGHAHARGAEDLPRGGEGVGAVHAQALGREGEEVARRSSKTGGAQVIEVDKKSFQDAMKPVYDKFITDPKLKDMLAKVQATK